MRVLVAAFEDVGGSRRPAGGLHRLDAVVEIAVRVPSGPVWASVTLASADRFWTCAASHESARQADEVQYALASGPCVDAILDDMVYHVRDVAHDPRWPAFARAAARPPVACMLSCPMVVMPVPGRDLRASLNIYAGRRSALDDEAVGFLLLLAAYGDLVASVVEDARRRARVRGFDFRGLL
ncbi:GAF domain-containing protein [Actinopolymorpha cephalotaxi]|uniref:GAF domain-containing protein n=1 Tax=Actinopolymorpha cephalotaxi TaxID=504797 RepID=A0A1I2ZRG5_9ACTN|nr:GAF domain-containing protein [Actinopolymorpha cephalotaxi]NYH84126.1 hypothetical protein [Actinopolymorpha cephalotaxi]SFH40398.1 GAF domain-containing protein [Actinopolymorpha cephalotaxi]